MSRQRIYLIGAGVIGRAHANAARTLYQENPGELTLHICDRDPAILQSFAEEFPEAQQWTDAGEMLAEAPQDSDVVVVGTPPGSHHPLTLQALRSGRHVLCEKPLAMNAEEAMEMLTAARETGRLLGCCSGRFIGDERAKLRDLLANTAGLYAGTWIDLRPRGRSGVEYQPQTPWFAQKRFSGGGCLMDWGSYDFTNLSYLLDPVEVVIEQAWVRVPEIGANLPEGVVADVDTHVGATLRYRLSGDREVVLNYERSSAYHGEGFGRQTFSAEGLGIKISHIGSEPAKLYRDRDGRMETEEFPDIDRKARNAHDRPLRYFLQRVTRGNGPAVVQEQAVFNFLIIQAIYRAAETGKPVRVVQSPEPKIEDSNLD